jgi:hypothetical protein
MEPARYHIRLFRQRFVSALHHVDHTPNARLEQCEPGLIFWLIEELLDSQTIEGCRKVFDYLESRRERNTKVPVLQVSHPDTGN